SSAKRSSRTRQFGSSSSRLDPSTCARRETSSSHASYNGRVSPRTVSSSIATAGTRSILDLRVDGADEGAAADPVDDADPAMGELEPEDRAERHPESVGKDNPEGDAVRDHDGGLPGMGGDDLAGRGQGPVLHLRYRLPGRECHLGRIVRPGEELGVALL